MQCHASSNFLSIFFIVHPKIFSLNEYQVIVCNIIQQGREIGPFTPCHLPRLISRGKKYKNAWNVQDFYMLSKFPRFSPYEKHGRKTRELLKTCKNRAHQNRQHLSGKISQSQGIFKSLSDVRHPILNS